MRVKLYVVHGSHPCAAVAKALALKGLPYSVVEWPPPMHAAMQQLIFGARTVPGVKIDGEKISGSRAIMRRLDQLAPEPPLFPHEPAARAAVEEAERWGDELFQPIARTLIWPAMRHSPEAMVGYSRGSKLPMPPAAIRVMAPVITRLECALNHTSDSAAQADLRTLPAHLDKIDAWIADGTIGGDPPNAADLQIGSTIRLLLTLADVRPLIAGRPCEALARRVFPDAPGEMPAGSLVAV